MVHSRRLRPLALLAAFGAVAASASLVAACTGKVSNGKVSSTSQPVSLAAITGTPAACPTGFAHPNACCETGPNQAASCLTYPEAPFTQCANGATTYPDPRTCCPLDGNGQCAAPPPPPSSDAGAPPPDTCSYPCPVGWYEPSDNGGGFPNGNSSGGTDGWTCCETNADGSGECMGGGSAGSGCTCGCPACDPDSGDCPPCPPCNCPPQPPPTTPNCNQCPPGWQVPQGDPLLCCTTEADGTIACFSQGVPPPPPPPPSDGGVVPVDDGGVAPGSCFGGGGGSPDGATFTQCGCSETVNGVDYTVTCTDPGATCTCSNDPNGTTTSTVPEPSTHCDDMGALFAACGFPQ